MANNLKRKGRNLFLKGTRSLKVSPISTVNKSISKVSCDIKLDFSDVLIVPRQSSLESRSQVNLEREFVFKNSNYTWSGIPIAVSNMDTTGTINMALEMQKHKVLTCLHKYYELEDLHESLDYNYCAISSGINESDINRLDNILTNKPNTKFVCLDVANGYMDKFVETCRSVREKYPDLIIIAGNVVTPFQVKRLIVDGGADIVKVGIGSGSVCTTRLKTGVGYPQLSAILECHKIARTFGGYIMSDGGIQNPGDLGKAFGAGADFVMCGSLFAGHLESGGEIIEEENESYKIFYGMSSKKAMVAHTGQMNSYRSEEGKVVKLKYRGRVKNTLDDYLGGLRSTMTYVGVKNIENLDKKVKFIRVNNQVNQLHNNKEVN